MSKPTFDEAYRQLEQIVSDVESDAITLDDLAAKVKQAKLLVKFCEEKLRDIEKELGNVEDAE